MLLAGAGSGGMVTSEGVVAWRGTVLRIGDVILLKLGQNIPLVPQCQTPVNFPMYFFARFRP
jgi:hypothetical protein